MVSRRNFFKGAGAVAVSTAVVSKVGAASLPEAVIMEHASTQPPLVSSTLGRNGVALGGLVRSLEVVSERLYGSAGIAVPRFRVPVNRPATQADVEADLAGDLLFDPVSTSLGAQLVAYASQH